MHVILPLAGLLVLLMGGFGVTMYLAPRSRSMGTLEVVSLSFLFGAGLVSLASFCTSLLYRGPVVLWVVSAGCVALGSAGGWAILRDRSRISVSLPPNVKTFVFSAILVLQILLVAWVALHDTLGWDGLVIWEFKARLATLEGGGVPTGYFSDATRGWSHPEYPHLVPLSVAWVYAWLGEPHQGYAKIIFALFYTVAVALLYSGASRLSRHQWRGLVPGFLLFFVPMAVIGEGSATSGYADFPLAVFYLASAIYLAEYLETGETGALALAGALATLLPWTKQEGIILWLCAAALIIAYGFRSRVLWPTLMAVFPGALVFAGWRTFLATVGAPQLRDFESVGVTTLWSNWGRIPLLAQWLVVEFADTARWSLLWPAFGLGLLFILLSKRRPGYLALGAAAALPLLLYTPIYVFTGYSRFLGHVENSLPRLMLSPSLVALVVIALDVPARPIRTQHREHGQ